MYKMVFRSALKKEGGPSMVYTSARPKGYAAWQPQAPTQLILNQVEEVLQQYKDYWPLSIRQIFYRLVGIYGYEKTEQAYRRLCEYLGRARRAGIIPFEAIRDDGWIRDNPHCYAGPGEFINTVIAAAENFTRDKRANQAYKVYILSEAAGMVPQLARVADPYSIPVMSSGGFDSLTVKYDLAKEAINSGSRAVFFHVGDYDPSGVCIYDSLAADVKAFAGGKVLFERIALTPEQIEHYNLPTAPAKKTDKRGNNITDTCQAEALPPDELARIVERAIIDLYDMPVFKEDCRREIEERQELISLFKRQL
jgi:hypothetical protein